jgi:hypothetical protein
MAPGRDCLECHGAGGGDAPRWTFAGTVYPALTSAESDGVRGVRVRVTDATGRTVAVVSNQAGNFYLADDLTFPLVRVEVERDGRVDVMDDDGVPIRVDYGGCNLCHAAPPRDGAPGRLVAP